MGKKGKKTRWRELPITLADKPYAAPEQHQSGRPHVAADAKPVNFAAAAGRRSHHAPHQSYQPHQQNHQQQQQHSQQQQSLPNRNQSIHAASNGQQHHHHHNHHHHNGHHVESSTVTFNEDEYTKITTPRQDVLFKKGYLGRRKHTSVPVITEVLNENEDGISTDPIMGQLNPLDELGQLGEYVDPSTMYILNGGGYEIYDPYTGTVTMLMGGPPPVGHPMLAPMPYQPMPMQPVDWYGQPPSGPVTDHWIPPSAAYPPSTRYHKKSTTVTPETDDQKNNSGDQSPTEASNGGVQESSADDHQQNLYHSAQPYVYPYVYGAPMYNYNGIGVQVPQPQSPPSPSVSCDYTNNGKRRKKKKRRKRGGVTDEYSDSSSEEQKSQSGASSDLVPDSEKTSDSGVLTNNSGGSTPVNVIPVAHHNHHQHHHHQLSHTAPPFHMECPPQPQFEYLHGAPILVHHHHPASADRHHHHHHHHHQMAAAYYQPIPQYADEPVTAMDLAGPIGYQVIPEEQTVDESPEHHNNHHHQTDVGEPATGNYSAENSDSGISSPNSEVMVKGGSGSGGSTEDKQRDKPLTNGVTNGTGTAVNGVSAGTAPATGSKRNRNKKSKQRAADKTAADKTEPTCQKSKNNGVSGGKDALQPKSHYHHEGGSKKASKIAKEPAIIKKLNARKCKGGKPEAEKVQGKAGNKVDDDEDEEDEDEVQTARTSVTVGRLSLVDPETSAATGTGAAADWAPQDEVFCSLECTPRSVAAADVLQFQFASCKTQQQSLDSCESAEEETFATAVNDRPMINGGHGESMDRDDDRDPDDGGKRRSCSPVPATPTTIAAASTQQQQPGSGHGPITEAVTKWLNDQGGLMLAARLRDDRSTSEESSCTADEADDDELSCSEYDDFEEPLLPVATETTTMVADAAADSSDTSPKNVQGNPCPAPSRNGDAAAGSRVATGANAADSSSSSRSSSPPPRPPSSTAPQSPPTPPSRNQRAAGGGLISSGICCLTQ